MLRSAFLSIAICVAGSSVALANVITFDTLTGSNADPYSGSSEVGFDIFPIENRWLQGFLFGNPVPSVFVNTSPQRPGPGELRVSRYDGGLFTFSSVDLGNGGGSSLSSVPFLIRGFRNSVQKFSFDGELTMPEQFETIFNTSPKARIDELVLSLFGENTTSYNVDNIVVSPIPLPAGLPLLAGGLGAMMLVRRFRKKHA